MKEYYYASSFVIVWNQLFVSRLVWKLHLKCDPAVQLRQVCGVTCAVPCGSVCVCDPRVDYEVYIVYFVRTNFCHNIYESSWLDFIINCTHCDSRWFGPLNWSRSWYKINKMALHSFLCFSYLLLCSISDDVKAHDTLGVSPKKCSGDMFPWEQKFSFSGFMWNR